LSNAVITFPLFGDGFSLDLPRYFTLFGFDIYYYAIFITLGYALAGFYLLRRSALFGLTRDNIYDIIIIAIPMGLIGARLYFMLFNFSSYFGPGQWGNILRFRDGGLAIYGGIIASGLVFIIYSRIKKIPLGNLLDAAGFGLFIGQAVGRWGNFINREAFGTITDLPWRMGLTTPAGTFYVHPTFLYESLWNIVGLIIMHIFSKKSKTKYPGQYFLFYVAWYGFGRFWIEGLRADSLFVGNPELGLRASQVLAAMSFLIALGILIGNRISKKGAVSETAKKSKNSKKSNKNDKKLDDDESLGEIDGSDDSTDDPAALDGAGEKDTETENEDNQEEK